MQKQKNLEWGSKRGSPNLSARGHWLQWATDICGICWARSASDFAKHACVPLQCCKVSWNVWHPCHTISSAHLTTLSLYTMSSSNLCFPLELFDILQSIHHFVIGNVCWTLIEARLQGLQLVAESVIRELVEYVPIFFFFLFCWCFSSIERQVTMAFASGDYPHARDRIGHIALLGRRYIVLLFAIRILEKVDVCFFLLLSWSVC